MPILRVPPFTLPSMCPLDKGSRLRTPSRQVNKEEPMSPNEPPRLRRRNSVDGFTKDDERLLRMLCAHCAHFLKHLSGDT